MTEHDDRVADSLASVARLTKAGYSANQIAVRLGLSSRTIVRYRKMLRLRSPGTGSGVTA